MRVKEMRAKAERRRIRKRRLAIAPGVGMVVVGGVLGG